MMGGSLVTGSLIGARGWYYRFAAEMRRAYATIGEEAAEAMGRFWEGVADSMAREGDSDEVSASDAPAERDSEPALSGEGAGTGRKRPPPEFIHLVEANLYLGGDNMTPSKGGVLWRGRLAEIDGFTLGKLSISRNE
jgi:hypothetical protein